jgi:integrase
MLTDAKARAAKSAEKPYKLTDAAGLYLHVMPTGAKVWRVRYEFDGREKLLTVGPYPSVGLAAARSARDAAKVHLRAGRDPSVARVAEAAARVDPATTLEAIASEWYQLRCGLWRDRHAEDVIGSLKRDVFPTLGACQIREITPKMVLDVLRVIEARPAIETAHRVRQRISAVFVYAIASDRAEHDPAAVVKGAMAPVVKGRQPAIIELVALRRVLTDAEAIPALPSTRIALRLLAITAVRPGEIRGAVAEEFFDLDGPEPLWLIPKERMKMKRDHAVPLPAQAVTLVRMAMTLAGRSRLLFPSARHVHRTMSENALGYLLNRAGYHGRHVPHGFRAAFSTIMNERDRRDKDVIDLMLAHVSKDRVEAAYNRAEHMAHRRRLAQAWADLLLEGLPEPESLLQLRWRVPLRGLERTQASISE